MLSAIIVNSHLWLFFYSVESTRSRYHAVFDSTGTATHGDRQAVVFK